MEATRKTKLFAVGGLLPSIWRAQVDVPETYILTNAVDERAAWRDYFASVTHYAGELNDRADYEKEASRVFRIRRPGCSEVLGDSTDKAKLFIHTYGLCMDDANDIMDIDVWHGGSATVIEVCDKVLVDLYTSSPLALTPAVLHGDTGVAFEDYVPESRQRMREAATFGDAVHAILEPGNVRYLACDLYIKRESRLVLNSPNISVEVGV